MQQTSKLYFAYGSNLLRKQMQLRCPKCKYIGLANLAGWKFQYDGICDDWSHMAVGNIIKSGVDDVWGAVYELCQSDIDYLDGYEDYPADYIKKSVRVALQPSGLPQNVFVYVRSGEATGKPSRKYEDTIIHGAKEDGLPIRYVNKYLRYHN